jgi:GTPase involved in cell partitioning and DNA repair
VIFEVDDRLEQPFEFSIHKEDTLLRTASQGLASTSRAESGKDAVIKVPPGTLIKDHDGAI